MPAPLGPMIGGDAAGWDGEVDSVEGGEAVVAGWRWWVVGPGLRPGRGGRCPGFVRVAGRLGGACRSAVGIRAAGSAGRAVPEFCRRGCRRPYRRAASLPGGPSPSALPPAVAAACVAPRTGPRGSGPPAPPVPRSGPPPPRPAPPRPGRPGGPPRAGRPGCCRRPGRPPPRTTGGRGRGRRRRGRRRAGPCRACRRPGRPGRRPPRRPRSFRVRDRHARRCRPCLVVAHGGQCPARAAPAHAGWREQ